MFILTRNINKLNNSTITRDIDLVFNCVQRSNFRISIVIKMFDMKSTKWKQKERNNEEPSITMRNLRQDKKSTFQTWQSRLMYVSLKFIRSCIWKPNLIHRPKWECHPFHVIGMLFKTLWHQFLAWKSGRKESLLGLV